MPDSSSKTPSHVDGRPVVVIESLDQEGRGIARLEGKTIFIEGAMAGEAVTFSSYRKKPTYEQAQVMRILRESPFRAAPRCPHFGVCGGCSMQHVEPQAQVAVKQRVLEDALQRIGKVTPDRLLPPIYGPAWGYRFRARLSVRYVEKKGGVLVGFHERRSSFVADMTSCEILPERISRLLPQLRELISGLSIRDRLPQIEVALGERDGKNIDVLVARILEPLTPTDEQKLKSFADTHQIQWYLQPKGPDTVYPFHPPVATLAYELPEFGVVMPFRPTEFTQVNPAINAVLVRRAIALLEPLPGERIGDLFCGLGNFTLPIARRGAYALGVEGSQGLVDRAKENAAVNGLADRTEFHVANLFEATPESLAAYGRLDRLLIDPPREGAVEVVKALPTEGIQRIVYVSCSPATLARDAAVLVHAQGYRLTAAGAVNMFPHTAHVESIAVFDRQ